MRAFRGLCFVFLLTLPGLGPAFGGVAHAAEEAAWAQIRGQYFGDRPITETAEVVVLHAPERAEDAAQVPIRVEAKLPAAQVTRLILFADNNPVPHIGTFRFGANDGPVELALNIRVDGYGPVRAIVEARDGSLYMSQRFVKASGGCSAPAMTDPKAAAFTMGQMRLRVTDAGPGSTVQLSIRHPNTSGLQRNQITQLPIPAHFIRELRVELDGQPVFAAETDISISENPRYRFPMPAANSGTLHVEAIDTQGSRFEHRQRLEDAGPHQVETAG